jgi:hypothetical protein
MRKVSTGFLLAALFVVATGLAIAQQGKAPAKAPAPVKSETDELVGLWNSVGNKLVAMAEDFPEDKYDFKVQKDQRSFAENILHVAGVDYLLMSTVKGSHVGPTFKGEDPPRSEYKSKADVVKLIKAAVADGAAMIKAGGESSLDKTTKFPFGNMMVHNSFNWMEAIEHTGEHYGQLVVYYRANNMVPPASRGQ